MVGWEEEYLGLDLKDHTRQRKEFTCNFFIYCNRSMSNNETALFFEVIVIDTCSAYILCYSPFL